MMKKVYEKPELNIVSYDSNSSLCTGCDISDPGFIIEMFEGWLGPDHLNDETYKKLFAVSESCEIKVDFEGYCKFTSAGMYTKIFTS